MQSTYAHIEEAARRFFSKVCPSDCWDNTDSPCKPLILAAFRLYALDWHHFDIRGWEWPFMELELGGEFMADQPWSVLLRRALQIARYGQ